MIAVNSTQSEKIGYPMGWEFIDQIKAAEYLRLNTHNRLKNRRTVSAYAAAMSRGEWRTNGDAIRISSTGVLLNGQHTLEAIELSGTTQLCLVIRELPDDVFRTLDAGRRRSISDALGYKGFKNSTILAAVISRLWAYEIARNSDVPPERRLTTSQCEQVAAAIPELTNSINECKSAAKHGTLTPSLGAMLWFATRETIDVRERFFAVLNGDSPATKKNPAFALRERFLAERETTVKKTPGRLAMMLTIKAWNLFHANREVGSLKIADGEAFPCIKGYGDEITASFPEWVTK